ncbi:S-layer homology domain-containing protein [Candidatus Peregrinibacteria bacterium]|nr:S-layer homology domain-containing protein [Candidatus Peregrinibacteria bacterium]
MSSKTLRVWVKWKLGIPLGISLFLMMPGLSLADQVPGQSSAEFSKLPFLREASSGSEVSGYGVRNVTGLNGSGSNPSKPEPVKLHSQEAGCGFKDISGHKNEKAIAYLYNKKVVGGRRACYFDPDKATTRAEAATMAVRAAKVAVPEKVEVKPFPDSKTNAWSTRYVKAAKDKEIVHGYPDKNYRAEQPVNRVESLKIVTRALQSDFSKTGAGTTAEVEAKKIKDIELNQWYAKYVEAGFNEGLIAPDTKTLYPTAYVTRAEYAQILYDMMVRRE